MTFDLRRAQSTRPGLLGMFIGILGVLLIALFLLVAFDAAVVRDLDQEVAHSAYNFSASRDGFVSVLETMAWIFGGYARIPTLLLFATFAWGRREHRIALWIVFATLIDTVANPLLKLSFHRDRPEWPQPLHEIGNYGFPSGHASGAGLFCTIAILLTIVLTGRGLRRRLIITLWVVLGVAVAASRVFLGVHYLSDVVAGLAIGAFIALTSWALMMGDHERHPHELAAVTGSGRKRLAVIFNPTKVGDNAEFKYRVSVAAAREGWNEPLWWETTIEDPGKGQAHQALESGVDLIVAAGGDGTVREVCDEVARTGVAVGILPHGTGNLLARNLAIPLNFKDALDTVFAGQDRAIDLATCSAGEGPETSFLVMAGLGMDAAIMTGVDDQLKSKVGWLAYFVSGLKSLRFPATRVQISVDDGEFQKFRARTVVVGNVGFLQAGIPLLPDAQIDDGLLDVVVIAPKRFLGWLAIVVRVLVRQRRTNKRLDRMTGHKVVIRAEKPTPMQLDGDPIGVNTEISIEVQPGVLLVRVPLAPPRRD
ncbi:MAG: YegS/Rv2252/BmrU family lipid kinase [Aeromicrobium sp.]